MRMQCTVKFQEHKWYDFFIITKNVLEDGQWAVIEWVDKLELCGCEFFQVLNEKIIIQKEYWIEKVFK